MAAPELEMRYYIAELRDLCGVEAQILKELLDLQKVAAAGGQVVEAIPPHLYEKEVEVPVVKDQID